MQNANTARSQLRMRARMLLSAIAFVLALVTAGVAAPQGAWAAPAQAAEVAAVEVADSTATGDEAPVEEIIEDEDVPLGVRRTVAIGNHMKPILIAAAIVIAAGFGYRLYRVNQNINKMNRRIR